MYVKGAAKMYEASDPKNELNLNSTVEATGRENTQLDLINFSNEKRQTES